MCDEVTLADVKYKDEEDVEDVEETQESTIDNYTGVSIKVRNCTHNPDLQANQCQHRCLSIRKLMRASGYHSSREVKSP